MGQRVRVDHDRHAVGQGVRERLLGVGVAARARPPRPAPGPRATTTSGCRRTHRVGRRARRSAPSRPARTAAPDVQSTAAPGYGSRAGADADDAAGVLVVERRRARQQRGDVVRLQRLDRRLGQVEPDVDEVHHPARLRRRVDEVGDLVGAEGDRHVGAHVRRRRAGRCRRRRPTGRPRRRPAPRRSGPSAASASAAGPAVPPMPTIPSTTTSGSVRLVDGRRAAAGARSAASPARAPSREQHRLDRPPRAGRAAPRRTARRRRCRPPRPAAAPGRRTPTPSRSRDATPARRRPLHQRPLGQPRHQRRLGRPHLLDGVCAPHALKLAVECSTAQRPLRHSTRGRRRRRDPAVVGQRQVHAARRPARAARAAPCRGARRTGRPAASTTTSASCQASPAGRAERLGQRLLGGEPGGQRLQRERGLGRA